MSRIAFFNIPAYGHTNPTLEVVRELVKRGHEVHYYSFREFRDRIENTGAACICCDEYMPPAPADIDKKVGRDLASLISMTVHVTLAMEERILKEFGEWKPDCIVSDSICIWGKLYAKRLGIPYVCSTTTFAFNRYTAKLMKQKPGEIFRMMAGMSEINARMEELRQHGYQADKFYELLQNDNDTDTIVYTSPEFQPMADTFSSRYRFTGPSLAVPVTAAAERRRPLVYVSLGTVLNKKDSFYRNCMEALKGENIDVIMAVGSRTDIPSLGDIPSNFTISPRVDQLQVLQEASVFITHCGMNSVSESLYFGVPLVLFPQQPEEGAVARRVRELGAGIFLKSTRPAALKRTVTYLLENKSCRENAGKIGAGLKRAGGALKAADTIEEIIEKK